MERQHDYKHHNSVPSCAFKKVVAIRALVAYCTSACHSTLPKTSPHPAHKHTDMCTHTSTLTSFPPSRHSTARAQTHPRKPDKRTRLQTRLPHLSHRTTLRHNVLARLFQHSVCKIGNQVFLAHGQEHAGGEGGPPVVERVGGGWGKEGGEVGDIEFRRWGGGHGRLE